MEGFVAGDVEAEAIVERVAPAEGLAGAAGMAPAGPVAAGPTHAPATDATRDAARKSRDARSVEWFVMWTPFVCLPHYERDVQNLFRNIAGFVGFPPFAPRHEPVDEGVDGRPEADAMPARDPMGYTPLRSLASRRMRQSVAR